MGRFLGWSFLEQFLPVLCDYSVCRAMGFDIPFWSFIIFIPVIVALARIPLSIGGFGVTEGLFVYFFAFVGVSGSEAFILGLAAHVLALLAVLPGFFYCAVSAHTPGPARQVRADRECA